MPERCLRIALISDIDDTIKDTKIFKGYRAAAKKTFFKEMQDVPGFQYVYNLFYKFLKIKYNHVCNWKNELEVLVKNLLFEKEKLKVARENQANDLAIARENAKGRSIDGKLSQHGSANDDGGR